MTVFGALSAIRPLDTIDAAMIKGIILRIDWPPGRLFYRREFGQLLRRIVSLDCIRHQAVRRNPDVKAYRRESAFCGHFSRVVVSNL
jgi:hypothetical protein